MSKVSTKVEIIWRAPDGAGGSQRRSPLHPFGLHRAHVAALRFLEALVPPRALPLSAADNIIVRALRRPPWGVASLQWRRLAAPGDGNNRKRGGSPNSSKYRRPVMDKLGRLYAAAQLDDELAVVVFFSLTGLDITLWLLAKGALVGAGSLFGALILG